MHLTTGSQPEESTIALTCVFFLCHTFTVFHQTVPHKLLDSGKSQGQNLALHLIIVAVTTPSDENNFPDNFSPWFQLAQKLAKVKLF